MKDPKIEEFNKLVGEVISRLGLLEGLHEKDPDDHKAKLMAYHVAIAFPNLSGLERAAIAGAFWTTHRLTLGVNILTLALSENDRLDWEQIVREDEHENRPHFQQALEGWDVRSKLTAFQAKLLDDLMHVDFRLGATTNKS